MKIFNSLTKSLFLFSLLFTFGFNLKAQSADEGKTLFNANCTACHAINDKVVGPALKDIHKRREEAWLVKWIKNSQALVKSGDATAVQLFKENNESVMTSFESLTDVQIKSIIAYVKAESETPAAALVASAAAPSAGVATNDSDFITGINWLLFIISILLVTIIIYVFNILGKIGQIQGIPVFNWNSINGVLLMIFLVVGLIATIWEFIVHGKLTVFADGPASVHGAAYDSMFMITLTITGIVFIITQVLLFWYGYKYKNDGKRKALYYPDNHKIELLWTVIPAIVLTILVVRGLIVWNAMTSSK
jgi:cytochrome c oxidase subunit 2